MALMGNPNAPGVDMAELAQVLKTLGITAQQRGCAAGAKWIQTSGQNVPARSPIDGRTLATVAWAGPKDIENTVHGAHEAFLKWRVVPAPKRGEFVRRISEKLRARKADLGALVSWEAGKITSEALGEVQE